MTTALKAPPYGRDTSATTCVHYGVISSGVRLVAESLLRRYMSRRGKLISDPNYGLDLVEWVQTNDLNGRNELALQSEMYAEAKKDERIDDVTITVTSILNNAIKSIAIRLDVTLDNGDTFTLALSVNDVTVELIELSTPPGIAA